MQPLSAKTHGIIDYVWSATVPILPRLFGWSPQATTLFTAIGLGTLGYSLLTDYPLGAVRMLPMPSHLAVDLLTGGALLTTPLWLDEPAQVQATLVGLGLVALVVSLNTDPHSAHDRLYQQQPRFAQDVYADPYLYD